MLFFTTDWSTTKDDGQNDLKYEGEYISEKINFFKSWLANFENVLFSFVFESTEIIKYELHGFGTLTSSEEIYKGYWENGDKHGKGTLTYLTGKESGIKEVGEWKDGELIKAITYNKDGSVLRECESECVDLNFLHFMKKYSESPSNK